MVDRNAQIRSIVPDANPRREDTYMHGSQYTFEGVLAANLDVDDMNIFDNDGVPDMDKVLYVGLHLMACSRIQFDLVAKCVIDNVTAPTQNEADDIVFNEFTKAKTQHIVEICNKLGISFEFEDESKS